MKLLLTLILFSFAKGIFIQIKTIMLEVKMSSIKTYGKEEYSESLIRLNYKNRIIWAEDLLKSEVL